MANDITIEGIEELEEKLEGLIDVQKLEAALGRACALVERSAKQKAPKDTGELRRSITSRVEKDGTNPVGIVSTPLEYAPYIMCGA